MISSSQRPLPNNTRHSQQTNIHAPGGIRTHGLSRLAAADLRRRPRGHWDRQLHKINQRNTQLSNLIFNFCCLLYVSKLVGSSSGRQVVYGMFTCINMSNLVDRRVLNTLSCPHMSAFRFVQLSLFQISQVITKYSRVAKKRAKETFRHFKLPAHS